MQQSLARGPRATDNKQQSSAWIWIASSGSTIPLAMPRATYVCNRLSARISARLRAVDTFARTGGDDVFVILLGELANRSSALTVARDVLESISKPIEAEGISFDISGFHWHFHLSR